MDDLLQEFIAETRETLEALSGEIVAWESAPQDRERLDAIFRFVHTVKGSCGFLDLPRLARLSHAAEDVLAAVRDGKRTPDTALVNAVLAIVDRIGEIVEAIDVGASLPDSGEDLLIAALDENADNDSDGVAAAAPQAQTAALRNASRSVRLNVDLLDRMMSGMSDMVLARNELARRLRDDDADPSVEAALERLSLTVAEMRETVTRTRMQKIDALFSALPRMVRDTAAEVGKSVTLHIEGSDVELDREMIEMMRDPLVHIVRNAIDHGIEAPAERRILGKRENGRLAISARQSGNQIIIEISDDGRGIDTERLIRKVAAEGARGEAELRLLSDKAKLDLVFEAGLSTKDEVTAISGRGVGMDVVRANVEQIGGRIELFSTLGKGLCIAIHVPLTLSIISTIGVGVEGQRFALPRQAIEEIVRVGGDAIRIDMLGDTPAATVRERRMPLVDLGHVLGFVRDPLAVPMLAIVSVSGGSYALAVDNVLDTEELVIKPAAPAVMAAGVYAGQTLPDSGLPMLLLDCAGIAAAAGLQFAREAILDDVVAEEAIDSGSALLFDDLDGTRRLVALEIIDRIELVPTDAIRFSAGRLRLSTDAGIVPLVAMGAWQDRADVAILRLRDGDSEIGYAISEALDIFALPNELVPAAEPGPVAGVVALDGEQVELLDLHWLFANHGGDQLSTTPPVCLIDGADQAWMMTFLKPVLEGAGYRVAAKLKKNESAAVVLTMDATPSVAAAQAPVIRLRREANASANDLSIYRYDRPGLLAALAQSAGGR
ncbi:MAG TPA: chemotaxis protein CheW [Sphingomonas sp.]|nr:chemotaxis protein CheW [Sphingomonas sp.]